MKELTVLNSNEISMTTVEIAERTGKEHRNVKRDARVMLLELYGEKDVLKFEHIYKDSYDRDQECYRLPKNEILILVSGYSIPLRAAIIKRLDELENRKPKELTRLELLEMAMESEKARLKLETENRRMLPKVESFETFLDTKGYYTLREAFKTLGQKPNVFTRMLRAEGILCYLHGNNVPKQEYLDRGYFEVKVNTNERLDKSFSQTYVTPKGMGWLRRRFVHVRSAAGTGCGARGMDLQLEGNR